MGEPLSRIKVDARVLVEESANAGSVPKIVMNEPVFFMSDVNGCQELKLCSPLKAISATAPC